MRQADGVGRETEGQDSPGGKAFVLPSRPGISIEMSLS